MCYAINITRILQDLKSKADAQAQQLNQAAQEAEAAAAKLKAELAEAHRTTRDLRGEVEQAKLNEAKATQALKGTILFLHCCL